MSKAMKIQVLALEDNDEVELLINGLNIIIMFRDNNHYSDSAIQKAREIKDELIKISTIFQATNNN